jgi:hypothetical protein
MPSTYNPWIMKFTLGLSLSLAASACDDHDAIEVESGGDSLSGRAPPDAQDDASADAALGDLDVASQSGDPTSLFGACGLMGGFCDASNTCIRYVWDDEGGGFAELVLGSCESGGGGGGGDGGGGGGGGGGCAAECCSDLDCNNGPNDFRFKCYRPGLFSASCDERCVAGDGMCQQAVYDENRSMCNEQNPNGSTYEPDDCVGLNNGSCLSTSDCVSNNRFCGIDTLTCVRGDNLDDCSPVSPNCPENFRCCPSGAIGDYICAPQRAEFGGVFCP